MSPEALMRPPSGVQVSWYWPGVQLALAAMATWPMTGALPLERVTASGANHLAKAACGVSPGLVKGLAEGAGFVSGSSGSCAVASGTANRRTRSGRMRRMDSSFMLAVELDCPHPDQHGRISCFDDDAQMFSAFCWRGRLDACGRWCVRAEAKCAEARSYRSVEARAQDCDAGSERRCASLRR